LHLSTKIKNGFRPLLQLRTKQPRLKTCLLRKTNNVKLYLLELKPDRGRQNDCFIAWTVYQALTRVQAWVFFSCQKSIVLQKVAVVLDDHGY